MLSITCLCQTVWPRSCPCQTSCPPLVRPAGASEKSSADQRRLSANPGKPLLPKSARTSARSLPPSLCPDPLPLFAASPQNYCLLLSVSVLFLVRHFPRGRSERSHRPEFPLFQHFRF